MSTTLYNFVIAKKYYTTLPNTLHPLLHVVMCRGGGGVVTVSSMRQLDARFQGVSATHFKTWYTRAACVLSAQEAPFIFPSPFFLSCSIPRLLIIPSLHSGKAAGFILGGAVKSF